MSSLSYQRDLTKILFAEEATAADFATLGASGERFRVYRRMARARLVACIEHGFERLVGVLGQERFRAVVEKFFAMSPPRSPYLRDAPGEFLAFFEAHEGELAATYRLPAYARDLARYEWAELETAYDFEEVGAAAVGPLAMDRPAVLSPAHRLIDVGFPVHRLGTSDEAVDMTPAPFSLCLYRDAKTHEVTALELTPVTARMLVLMEAQSTSLTDVVRNAASQVGVQVDVAFVDALSTLLADLTERGVLLGSMAQKETT